MRQAIQMLITEPIPDIRELYRIILDPVTDWVDFASDNQEALARIRERHYDAVLLDAGVPELDGLDCARIVNEWRPDLPVVVCSSVKLPTRLAARLLSHPVNFLVNKPFDIRQIRAVVQHACRSAGPRCEFDDLPKQHVESVPDAV